MTKKLEPKFKEGDYVYFMDYNYLTKCLITEVRIKQRDNTIRYNIKFPYPDGIGIAQRYIPENTLYKSKTEVLDDIKQQIKIVDNRFIESFKKMIEVEEKKLDKIKEESQEKINNILKLFKN